MPEPTPYRLELDPALEGFAGEIDYALGYVERAHALVRRPEATRTLRYGGPDSQTPACLFSDVIQAGQDGLHVDRAALSAANDLWPRENARHGTLSYDAVGLIFFMLSRIEERGAAAPDRHERFCPVGDSAVARGLHGTPIVDDAAAAIAGLILGATASSETRYEVVPTHDVDILKRYHRWWEPLRLAAGDVIRRGRPRSALRRLGAYRPGEPETSFRDMMNLSERLGLTSRFFMMGASRDPMDSPYAAVMRGRTRRMAREVRSRGHRIGFHPGYRTLGDAQAFRRQRASLEAVIGRPVSEGRQHVLRYDAAATPALWDAEAMTEDFTLAYPGLCGFRNGACRPYDAFDLVARRRLRLLQTATAIMDFSLFDSRYNKVGVEQALEQTAGIVAAVRRHGGRLVVLHHTGQAEGPARAFYGRLLEAAA